MARVRDAEELIQELTDERFQRPLRSYGDELVLGIGDVLVVPGTRDELAEYMLFTKETPWFIEAREERIATHKQRLSERKLARLHHALHGATVERVHVIEEVVGLVLDFSNGGRFLLWPSADTVSARSEEVLWELWTPFGVNVVASGATGLRSVQNDTLVEASNTHGVEKAVPAAREGDIASIVRQAAKSVDFRVFEPRTRAERSTPDLIAVSPTGDLVVIEVITGYEQTRTEFRVPRLVLYDPTAHPERYGLPENERVVRNLATSDLTPDRVAVALRELAAAA